MIRFPQIFYSKQSLHGKLRLIIIEFWYKENIVHKFRNQHAEEMGVQIQIFCLQFQISPLYDSYLILFFFNCHMPRLSSISWIIWVYIVLILP